MPIPLPNIQALSTKVDKEVRQALDAIRGWLTSIAADGGMVTQRSLPSPVDWSKDPTLYPFFDGSIPPQIQNLEATGAFRNIMLSWDEPYYLHLSYVEVWRHTADDLGAAVLIGTTKSTIYADIPPNASLAIDYYYWVRIISMAGIKGPFNATAGTMAHTANDPAYILELLAGQITASELHTTLNSRIDLVPGLVTRMGSAEEVLASALAQLGELTTSIFSDTETYALDAIVMYQGKIYKCIKEITETPAPAPTDAEYWLLIGDYASLTVSVGALSTTVSGLSINYSTVSSRVTATEGDIVAHSGRLDGLESTVSDPATGIIATRALLQNSYSTTATMSAAIVEAKSAAIAQAGSNVATQLTNYTTFANMNSATTSAVNQAVSAAGINVANILTNYYTKADTTGAIATAINTLSATSVGGLTAALQIEQQVRALTIGPNWLPNTLYQPGKVVQYNGSLFQCRQATTSIPENGTYWKVVAADLYAQYTVKTDVNGKISGFGMANDGATSAFEIITDRFAIVNTALGVTKFPFIVDAVYGVVMDVALIKDATITSAKIENLTADKLTVPDIGTIWEAIINLGKITNAFIGDTIQSTIYTPGAGGTGWKIDKAGTIRGQGLIVEDAAIGTLKIAGNAVTVPQFASRCGQGLQYITANQAWQTAGASITVTLDYNYPLLFTATVTSNCYATNASQGMLLVLLRRDGATSPVLVSSDLYHRNTMSFSWLDSPGVGTFNYYLQFWFSEPNNEGYSWVSDSSISVMGAKR
jgi:hypothetical protein